MKIPKEFPQFQNEKVLLLATGKESAAIYIASDGELTELRSFKLPPEKYTYPEARFEHRGHGAILGVGTVYEKHDEVRTQKFFKKLEEAMESLVEKNHISHLYLFAPTYFLKQVEKHLPKKWRQQIAKKFDGNFTRVKPLELLQKIKTDLAGKKI
jgi:hypothetical protein